MTDVDSGNMLIVLNYSNMSQKYYKNTCVNFYFKVCQPKIEFAFELLDNLHEKQFHYHKSQ